MASNKLFQIQQGRYTYKFIATVKIQIQDLHEIKLEKTESQYGGGELDVNSHPSLKSHLHLTVAKGGKIGLLPWCDTWCTGLALGKAFKPRSSQPTQIGLTHFFRGRKRKGRRERRGRG